MKRAAKTGNIVKGLDYDSVMEFEYLAQCFNESMRIEPPVAVSLMQTV